MTGHGFVLTLILMIEQILRIMSIHVNVGRVGRNKMAKMHFDMEVMSIEHEWDGMWNSIPITVVRGICNEDILKESKCLEIQKVIFNNPATVILWKDGTKTVVKCNGRDTYDPEKGFAMAISKKVLGSYPAIKRIIRKYSPDDEITLKQFSKESGLKIGYSVENITE